MEGAMRVTYAGHTGIFIGEIGFLPENRLTKQLPGAFLFSAVAI